MGVPENWGEILGELMAGPPPPKPAPEAPGNPFDPAGVGEMISRMMRAGAAGLAAAAPRRSPRPRPRPPAPAESRSAAKPARRRRRRARRIPAPSPAPEAERRSAAKPDDTKEPAAEVDALTRLIETGREVQQQHMRNLQAVMSQVWGGDAQS